MAKELSVEEAIARARRVQGNRIESIRKLAEARQNVADVREQAAQRVAEVQRETTDQVAVAEREDVARYSSAQAAG